jgi:hypothetical protein
MERLDIGEQLPELHVIARWWTNPNTWIPQYGGWPGGLVAGVHGLRALVRRKRRGPAGEGQGAYVALRRHDGNGDAPDLILKVDPRMLPSPAGEDSATIIGEFGPNGALCLVLRA